MKVKEYNRQKCLEYANQWALSRNPKYYDYEKIGGDCTNFASQCIYAGSGVIEMLIINRLRGQEWNFYMIFCFKISL